MTTHGLTIKERIQAHIISKDGCWITNYKIDHAGRPSIVINKKTCILARVVYEIYKDDFLGNQSVCHRCDNLLCVNPEHLYIGKNRRNQTTNSSKSGAKLNEVEVRQIRDLLTEGKLTLKQIGNMFGVSYQMIRLINNGEAWTHIEGIGSKIRTRKTGNVKLNETQVMKIRDCLVEGRLTFNQIGEMFGVSHWTIRLIDKGKIWTHVEGIGKTIKKKSDKNLTMKSQSRL